MSGGPQPLSSGLKANTSLTSGQHGRLRSQMYPHARASSEAPALQEQLQVLSRPHGSSFLAASHLPLANHASHTHAPRVTNRPNL